LRPRVAKPRAERKLVSIISLFTDYTYPAHSCRCESCRREEGGCCQERSCEERGRQEASGKSASGKSASGESEGRKEGSFFGQVRPPGTVPRLNVERRLGTCDVMIIRCITPSPQKNSCFMLSWINTPVIPVRWRCTYTCPFGKHRS
jgi:hypothetical protein